MLINTDKGTIKVSFDEKGSLYFDTDNASYQLEINRLSKPELVEGDYTVIKEYNYSTGSITKINEDSQYDEQEFENQQSGSIPLSMYPEEGGYMFTEPDFDYKDEDEGQFHFLGSGVDIFERTNGYYNALYDTFINDSDNTTYFRTKLMGEPPLYIVIIRDNKLFFRDSCRENLWEYTLMFDDSNKLILKPA